MSRQAFKSNQRKEVALAAARLMQEQGMDYLSAKKKAALQLGLQDQAALPTNQEVEQAMLENQRLFAADDAKSALRELRKIALNAMQLVEEFRPRLVGEVLSGALTAAASIELHVFCDHSEQVAFKLMDSSIEYRLQEKRMRWRADVYTLVPVYSLVMEDTDLLIYVFDHNGERQSPLSPVDGRPMVRKSRADIETMIAAGATTSIVDQFFG